MKKMLPLLILTLFMSSVSMAHPQDTDSVMHLGIGSHLQLKKDLILNSYQQSITFSKDMDSRYRKNISSTNKLNVFCHLISPSYYNVDRVLRANTILTVQGVDRQSPSFYAGPEHLWTYLKLTTPKGNRLRIKCLTYLNQSSSASPTIGELKEVLGEFFDLTLSEPRKFE